MTINCIVILSENAPEKEEKGKHSVSPRPTTFDFLTMINGLVASQSKKNHCLNLFSDSALTAMSEFSQFCGFRGLWEFDLC